MDKLLNTNLLYIRIYLTVKKCFRVLLLILLMVLMYHFYEVIVKDSAVDVFLISVIVAFIIIFEVSIRCYKWMNKKFLDELHEFVSAEISLREQTKENYEKLYEEFLIGDSSLLSDDTRALMEKEENGEGFISLQLMKARVEYGIAIVHQRKLNKLYRLLKKWY